MKKSENESFIVEPNKIEQNCMKFKLTSAGACVSMADPFALAWESVMLISEEEAATRLNSPLNLMNRLRRSSFSSKKAESAMGLFTGHPDQVRVPEVIPAATTPSGSSPGISNLDSILDNADSKIKQELIHNAATAAMQTAIQELTAKIHLEDKPQRLADIAVKMSKIVSDIRDDRKGTDGKDKQVHLHFYTPERKTLAEYKEVEV